MIDRFEHCRFCGGRGCAACPEEARKWEANGGAFPKPGPTPPPPPDPEIGPCYACGEPARFLCDGPAEDHAVAKAEGRKARTCDRPMCDHHVAYQSKIHVQRAGPGGRGRRCSWKTYDLCSDCRAALEASAKEATNAGR